MGCPAGFRAGLSSGRHRQVGRLGAASYIKDFRVLREKAADRPLI